MICDSTKDGFTQESIDAYNRAVASGDVREIEHAKYAMLIDTISFLGIVTNYILLERQGVSFDFGVSVIPKGTMLFRIRGYKTGVDFNDPSEWAPNPERRQGRVNREGQEALYLGSTERVCLLETHAAVGQQYALGIYECVDDLVVSGFARFDNENAMHDIAGTVLNAFLIAPSRSEWNFELFEFLDEHYGRITCDDLCGIKDVTVRGGFELPFKFGVLNQRDELHALTNDISEILAKKAPDGIRYSSCYLPFETIGIACTDYNLALNRSGIDKLEFLGCEIKTNDNPMTLVEVVKCLLESGE